MMRLLPILLLTITAACQRSVPPSVAIAPETPTKLTPIEAAQTATLRGRVTYLGARPEPRNLAEAVQANPDREHCVRDPNGVGDETWVIAKDGGVANVVLWLRPANGQYFQLPKQQTWKDKVVIDAPYCSFEPHVAVTFLHHFDGEKMRPTGQNLILTNTAPISHNFNYHDGPISALSFAPGEVRRIDIPPSYNQAIKLVCDRHKWMTGYVWALPTSYAAVTGKDGEYEIVGIPAGVSVRLVLWHEQAGFFGTGGKEGEAITLHPGDNDRSFTIQAKND